jgi:hypothetical protein
MAYKKSTATSSLKDILARVNGETVIHKPVVYCAADISRAKTVLDRLLAQANSCEVSYIKQAVNKVEEL